MPDDVLSERELLACNAVLKDIVDEWNQGNSVNFVALLRVMNMGCARAVGIMRRAPKGTDCGNIA